MDEKLTFPYQKNMLDMKKMQQMRAKQSWSSGPGKNRVQKLNKMTTGAEHTHIHTHT